MSKYRKKPVVIEAEKFSEKTYRESKFLSIAVRDKFNMGEFWIDKTAKDGRYYIDTLEGWMQVNEGDYIIKGIQGEFYPCKPDIFEATYEEVIDYDGVLRIT